MNENTSTSTSTNQTAPKTFDIIGDYDLNSHRQLVRSFLDGVLPSG